MHRSDRMTVLIVALALVMCTPTWACHETIHFTKAEIEGANIRLYERDVSERDRNLTGFDQKHGMVSAVLGSQQIYAQDLEAWRLHPDRFGHEHHGLWRVIDGDMLFHKKHPYQQPIPPVPPGWLPRGGGGPAPPGSPSGGGPGSPVHSYGTVPEPSSGVLGITAIVVGLLAAVCRRAAGSQKRSRQAL
jgi:hypothetical protein